jgi:hypothetical protein
MAYRQAANLMTKFGFTDIRLDLGFYMPEKAIRTFRQELRRKVNREVSVLIEIGLSFGTIQWRRRIWFL